MRTYGLAIALLLLAPRAGAELPPLSPDELQDSATHIVAGLVTEVFAVEKDKDPDWIDELVVIELRVLDVEKGDGIDPARALYARAWQAARRPEGWTGPGGQLRIPVVGEVVRVHLRLVEGGVYETLTPNGIQATEEVEGILRHRPWTKSEESYEAGGSDYFVLEDGSGARLYFVRPTAAVSAESLAALDGKRVLTRGAVVPGRRVEVDPDTQHPGEVGDPGAPSGSRREGQGLRAYEASARE